MNSTRAIPQRALQLAPHVHTCYSNSQVVLLDSRRDKYLAISGASAHALAASVEGWPVNLCAAASTPANVGALMKRMLDDGLLVDTAHVNSRLPTATVPEAVATLSEPPAGSDARVRARRVVRFTSSVIAAATALRFRSLFEVAQAVARRRRGLAQKAGTLSLDAAQEAVTAFQRLRPLLFTSYDKCLFDSLALINFLASERIFPRWVIGVKTQPFAAHAWVQSEGTVLNDLHEHVRRFSPILVI